MNIMEKTPAKITIQIDGMTWAQARDLIEDRYGALMWDHTSTAYPADGLVVRMAFAEPAGEVAQRAIGNAAPRQDAQRLRETPYANCRFQICNLPGQCKGEGKCHHPAAPQQNAPAVQHKTINDAHNILADAASAAKGKALVFQMLAALETCTQPGGFHGASQYYDDVKVDSAITAARAWLLKGGAA